MSKYNQQSDYIEKHNLGGKMTQNYMSGDGMVMA